jgi:SAM-dependent methyltransferase
VHDPKTAEYFDREMPVFHPDRMEGAIAAVKREATPESSLIDLGCGMGNILESIREATGLRRLAGMDVSQRCLENARSRLGCSTYLGSILDRDFVGTITDRFDFAVLGAVLHHLVGRSRRESRRMASTALTNSLALVREGGLLIVVEPVFYPKLTMDLVFYVKKAVTTFTNQRLPILGYWNNIGAPVVSYYRTEDLIEMVDREPSGRLIGSEVKPRALPLLLRLASVRRREEATLLVRKVGE